MSSLRERALFFGAGLVFGAALGLLLGDRPPAAVTAGPEAAPQPDPAPTAPPVDAELLQSLLDEVEARPEDPAARAAVGDLHLGARDFREAAYWLQQARNLDPSDLDIRSRLAFALVGLGDVSGAIAGYEAVLAEDPQHFESLVALGRLRLFAEQDLAAGVALWERAIAVAPDSAEAAALRTEIEALRAAHP